MIFPDINMLLYAYDDGSKFHTSAKSWLENALLQDEVFFSWHTITGFLRIATNPRILSNPASIEEAISVVTAWLALDNTHLISLKKMNWPLFSKILIEGQATGNLVMDAHVAAMAASCGATVASTDRDFTRFPNIQFVDPISKT
jgi:hypothetical protein